MAHLCTGQMAGSSASRTDQADRHKIEYHAGARSRPMLLDLPDVRIDGKYMARSLGVGIFNSRLQSRDHRR